MSVSHIRNRSCENLNDLRRGSTNKKMFLKGTQILKQPTMDIDLAHRKVTFDNFDNNIEKAESIIDNKDNMLLNEVYLNEF